MHSRIITALIAATALMMGGCASEPETTLKPGQKAFVFESGVVPIGDFDPYAFELDELFDPCNEISDEEFARAGFTGVKKSSSKGEVESPHGTSVCTFHIGNRSGISVASVDANRALSEMADNFLPHMKSSLIDEMYFYQPSRATSPFPCYAQVDTVRGAIGVSFYTSNRNYSDEEMCTITRDKLEALYLLQNR